MKVSFVIEKVCKDLGIKYKSPNRPKMKQYQKDAEKLADIYIQLGEIILELTEIEKRYEDLKGIKDLLLDDIKHLYEVNHHLLTEAQKIVRDKRKKL